MARRVDPDADLTLEDLNGRQLNRLGQLELGNETGNQKHTNKATKRLTNRFGLTDDQIASLLEQSDGSQAEGFLDNRSTKGPIAGRRAARDEVLLREERSFDLLDDAAETGRTRASSDIARQAADFDERLSALAGVPLNADSPSVQAVLAQGLLARENAHSDAMLEIDERLSFAKSAITQDNAAMLSPLLVSVGDTVFALDQLDKQEEALRNAQIGQMFGTFGGPVAGAIGGGIYGGTQGASSGTAAGMDTMALMLKAFGAGGFGGGA